MSEAVKEDSAKECSRCAALRRELAEAKAVIEQVKRDEQDDIPTRSATYVHALNTIIKLRAERDAARREVEAWRAEVKRRFDVDDEELDSMCDRTRREAEKIVKEGVPQ